MDSGIIVAMIFILVMMVGFFSLGILAMRNGMQQTMILAMLQKLVGLSQIMRDSKESLNTIDKNIQDIKNNV